jgi:hypothetical protein
MDPSPRAAATPSRSSGSGGGALVSATFMGGPPFGIKHGDVFPTVTRVTPGSQASLCPQLRPGLVLVGVQGQSVVGLSFKQVQAKVVAAAGQPITLTFGSDVSIALQPAQQSAGPSQPVYEQATGVATPILTVLKKARLEQHVEAFREMGCVELADLADMNFPDTPFLRKLEFKRLMRVTIRTCIIILFTFLKSRATNIRMTGPGINLALPHHLDVVLNQLLCQEAGCSADVVARKVAHVSTREAQAVKVEPRPQPAAEVNLTDTSDAILMIELVSGSAIDLRESIGIAAGLPGMLG